VAHHDVRVEVTIRADNLLRGVNERPAIAGGEGRVRVGKRGWYDSRHIQRATTSDKESVSNNNTNAGDT